MGGTGSPTGGLFSLASIQPSFHSKLPASVDLVVAAFLFVTGMMSLLGNGTVLLVYFRKRKKLRPQELMTINLAVCDFAFSLIGAPFAIVSSLCHAWVFGEAGCLWYGIQGFVFGLGSLITTCLISLDRCLKICCLRYGQLLERHHIFLSVTLVWLYVVLWATLPIFGFGSYGPEPYGTSCTINWWSMRSSLNDRIYILLILILCLGLPALIIITSYTTILITVYRSNRMFASMPFSSTSHTRSTDLRLTKIAAVVCGSFLVAWIPYAAGSLYSALVHGGGDDEAWSWGHPQAEPPWMLRNWTLVWPGGEVPFNSSGGYWSNTSSSASDLSPAASALGAAPVQAVGGPSETESPPSGTPMLSLIPVMLAKSHCMFNPFIYQMMNPEFRQAALNVLLCRGHRRASGIDEAPTDVHSYWPKRRSCASAVRGAADETTEGARLGASLGEKASGPTTVCQ